MIGLASIATVDKRTLVILSIVSKPVQFMTWLAQNIFGLSDGTTAQMGWLCLAIYWMIIGGLIGWGVSALHCKATGDQ